MLQEGRRIPRGALVRYREWYGARSPNVGLKLTAEEVARGILERDEADYQDGRLLRTASLISQRSLRTVARRLLNAWPVLASRSGQRTTAVSRAPGAIGGWDQVRARMKGDLDDNPMLFVFSTCIDTIRTVPIMQRSGPARRYGERR